MFALDGRDPAAKVYRRGTHRTSVPDDTIARIRPLMDTVGITRVANLTGLDRIGIPVVMVCRPNSRSSAVFHGKGLDLAAAKASGLMEAIETWHAEHVELPLKLGSAAELGISHQLAEVDGLARIPASRFDPDLAMLWVEGQDLIGGQPVWLPLETVHANSVGPAPPGSGCFLASTNGLASGNHPLEAASHALCEVIERDATSLWRRRPRAAQDATRLDLGTVADDDCRAVIELIRRAELDVAVWDVTTDIGVPALLCQVLDLGGEIAHVGQGAGCHSSREVALLRALTEAVQVRTTYIVGSREDIQYADYHPATLEARQRQARAIMQPVGGMRDFASLGGRAFDTFDAEVAWIVDRLKAAGTRQAIAVDLSRPGFGVSVVRVVIPGLEGSDHLPDYVPGPRARAHLERRP